MFLPNSDESCNYSDLLCCELTDLSPQCIIDSPLKFFKVYMPHATQHLTRHPKFHISSYTEPVLSQYLLTPLLMSCPLVTGALVVVSGVSTCLTDGSFRLVSCPGNVGLPPGLDIMEVGVSGMHFILESRCTRRECKSV